MWLASEWPQDALCGRCLLLACAHPPDLHNRSVEKRRMSVEWQLFRRCGASKGYVSSNVSALLAKSEQPEKNVSTMQPTPMQPTTIPSRIPSSDSSVNVVASRLLLATGIWLISSAIVSWFEFGIFWNLPLLLFAMNLNSFDQVLVVGSLLSRTLIVTFPAMVVLALAIKKQWHWKWKTLAWTFHFAVLVWIVVDCGLQCVTGANLWHYVQKATTTEDLTVGGNIGLLLSGIKTALSVIAMQMIAVVIVGKFVVRWLRTSRWKQLLPQLQVAALMLIGGFVLTMIVARHFVNQRPALEQLYGTITLRTWMFHPDRISEYGEAAFGTECEADFQNLQADLNVLFHSDVCRPEQNLVGSAGDPAHTEHRFTSSFGGADSSIAESDHATSQPHVILLLTESLRHDALTPQNMPKLWAAGQQGVLANQHSTNSNCSEFGAFAALYGRYAMCYESVLDDQVPSVAMQTLKQLGYQRQMVNSCSVNFSRMNEFLSDLNFDRISVHNPKGNPWHDNDRRTLDEISQIVTTEKTPQFVFSILMATHYSYDYPVEYDKQSPNHRPALKADAANHEVLEDRYWKSVSFLDQQISELIESVRDTNTIVIVTGDHGESFLDDGFLCHGTRLSKIQTQTPLLIVGGGVHSGAISVPTGHIDLMPTILELAGGRAEVNDVDGSSAYRSGFAGPGQNLLARSLIHSHHVSVVPTLPQRSQLVVQARTNDWEIALQHRDGILAFQTGRSGEDLKVTGFLNEFGRIDSGQRRLPSEIPVWNQRIKQAVKAAAKGIPAAIRLADQSR